MQGPRDPSLITENQEYGGPRGPGPGIDLTIDKPCRGKPWQRVNDIFKDDRHYTSQKRAIFRFLYYLLHD